MTLGVRPQPPEQFKLTELRRQIEKPQRDFRCGFCGPDTRQRLLPLLPFGPDGVGSVAAVRLGKCFTCKEVGCQCPASNSRAATGHCYCKLPARSALRLLLFVPKASISVYTALICCLPPVIASAGKYSVNWVGSCVRQGFASLTSVSCFSSLPLLALFPDAANRAEQKHCS